MDKARAHVEALAKRAEQGDPQALKQLQVLVQRQYALRAQLARNDPNVFVPFVLRDEETGGPVAQAPYHCEMQDMVSMHSRVVMWGHVESGKTQQLSVGRPLWEIGRNPNLRVVVIQSTQDQAAKTTSLIGRYILKSERFRAVFPNCLPDPNGPWNTTALTVQRTAPVRDVTLRAVGVTGIGSVLGSRIDLLIMDDILTQDNTRTAEGRKAVLDLITRTLMGRLTKNARVILIGNAWHPEDAMHILARPQALGGYEWHSQKFPVRDPETGRPIWPEKWTEGPDGYLAKKIHDLGGPDHPEVARQLDCVARNEDAARFKSAWIELAKERGHALYGTDLMLDRLPELPRGCRTFTGVDLGTRKTAGADLTCLFTLMAYPNGDIQVINCESGKWSGPEILRRVFDAHARFHSTVIVEDVAAQDFIRQFAKDPVVARALGREDISRIPIYPGSVRGKGTYGNKHHHQFGVESIGAEMATGRWVIPTGPDGRMHPEVEAWVQDMLYYDPRSHTGDRLMAAWHAHNGARRRGFSHQVVNVGDQRHLDWVEADLEQKEQRRQKTAEQRQRERLEAQKQSAWGF